MAQAALPITHDAHSDHPAPSAGVTNTKLGMWVFLSSDCLFFGAFITTYLLYRNRNLTGPTPRSLYNIPFTSVTSFILLMSSLTMVLALAAIQRGDMRRFKVWVMATAVFGMLFIGGQVFEFTEFYREGLSLRTNVSSSIFFVATGIHGLHVTIGIIWLLSLWGMAMQGKFGQKDSEAVEVSGLYWHFVDVVWIAIFAVVYLIP